jgi:drug/metabolite transporter (DMT)-like permease
MISSAARSEVVASGETENGTPQGSIAKAQANQRKWTVLALLSVYIIWSTTYLGIRYALESFPPYLMMGIRFVIAGGGLGIVLLLRGGPMPTRRQIRSATIVGILLLVFGMGSVALAEQSISSGLAATLVATSPVWAMIFSMLWGDRPHRREWVGVALGLFGVGVLSLEGNLQANPLGVALMIFAPAAWGLGSVWSKHLDMPKGAMANAAEMFIGGAILVVLGLLRGERILTPPTLNASLAMIYLITFGSLVTLTAYMYLLKTVSPALATSYALVNPALALLLGALVGEQITGSALIALPIILTGVAFVAFRKKQPKPAIEPTIPE